MKVQDSIQEKNTTQYSKAKESLVERNVHTEGIKMNV